MDNAVKKSLEDTDKAKDAICVGDQTLLELGVCVDPVCAITGQNPFEGVCALEEEEEDLCFSNIYLDGICVVGTAEEIEQARLAEVARLAEIARLAAIALQEQLEDPEISDLDKVQLAECGKVCESYETCVLGACDSSSVQYTPDQADWYFSFIIVLSRTKMDALALKAGSTTEKTNTNHSPSGVWWFNYKEWDGVPRPFSSFPSKQAFFDWICPGAGPRGIKEVYEIDPIFADPVNPTKAEVDHWHRRYLTLLV